MKVINLFDTLTDLFGDLWGESMACWGPCTNEFRARIGRTVWGKSRHLH